MSTYWHQMVAQAFDRDQHRPLDRETARAAARELRARGLTPRDIAAALRLSENAVRELLQG
jgi:sugar (pentulose or hexulose) kinase